MNHVNIFDVAIELDRWGFWYCLWRGYRLKDIFIASRINRYQLNR
jgi:hypothetical protein